MNIQTFILNSFCRLQGMLESEIKSFLSDLPHDAQRRVFLALEPLCVLSPQFMVRLIPPMTDTLERLEKLRGADKQLRYPSILPDVNEFSFLFFRFLHNHIPQHVYISIMCVNQSNALSFSVI